MQAAHSRPGKLYTPSAERHSLYQKVFTTYTALYPRLKDLYPSCSAIVPEAEATPGMYTYSKQIPILASPDILVVGSGSAGATAAIAAARLAQQSSRPKRVMLVERYGFLGGTSTACFWTPLGVLYPEAAVQKRS